MPFSSIGTVLTSVKLARIRRSIAVRNVFAVLACAVMVGCGSGSPTQLTQQRTTVTVTPSSFTMGIGSNYQFVATVTGTTNTAVNWQVNGMGGGEATVGTIDSTGLYIAPGNIPGGPISVTAVAQADGVTSGSAAITLDPSLHDPLGSATSQPITCPSGIGGVTPGTCYSLVLSCPGIADLNGYLWVNTPSGTPVGTVLLTVGGTSVDLYADPNAFVHGADVVNGLLAAGYVTVQTSFGGVFNANQTHGWEAGPGGIRRVACRYATLAQWVQQNIAQGKPVCATGNSAGSALIGYALAHYGGDSIFTMVEPTSGPPYSRLDHACECNEQDLQDPCGPQGENLSQCVGTADAQNFIDPAYSSPICSQAVTSHSTANSAQFLSDSILSPEASMNYSSTSVHFVWGGLDPSSAPVMGEEWQQKIISPAAHVCVPDAPHSIPDVLDGAGQILKDIVASCH